MATDLDLRLLDGAGKALRELRLHGNVAEAQVSLALICTFICSQYNIPMDALLSVLRSNIMQASDDPALMTRVVEHLHNVAATGVIVAPSAEPEYRYKVGDLQKHAKH